MESGGVPLAVTNGKINVLAREVDVMGLSAYPEIDFRVDLGEAAEPMNEPLRCEIRRDAHGERAAALPLQQPLGSLGDAVEGITYNDEIVTTCLGDHQSLALTIEKLQPEFGLECLDLMTDGTLSNEKLLGSAREAFMTCRSLKGLEGIQSRHPARH